MNKFLEFIRKLREAEKAIKSTRETRSVVNPELYSTFTPETKQALELIYKAPRWQFSERPGYLIKSLMKDSPIYKLVSKNGTISVQLLLLFINRPEVSNIDKYLIGEYLKQTPNHGAVYVDDLRDFVLSQVPKYDRVSLTDYEDYGIDRLGFGPLNDNSRTSSSLALNPIFNLHYYITDNPITGDPLFYRRDFPFDEVSIEEIEEFINNNISSLMPYKLSTFSFESPGIIGNTLHYGGNPIGHSRTYTTQNEPDVLHVMESQSDWAQHPFSLSDKLIAEELEKGLDRIYKLLKRVEDYERSLQTGIFPDGRLGDKFGLEQIKNEFLPNARKRLDEFKQRYNFALNGPNPIESHLLKTYPPRQIQENLRYAAEKGLKRMRYPTPETAAKIEGYSKIKTETLEAKDIYNLYENEIRNVILQHPEWKIKKILFSEADFSDDLSKSIFRGYKTRDLEGKKVLKLIEDKYKPLYDKATAIPQYSLEHQTILKKYADFPKQYQKLFKGSEVRTVTDAKGNTWYEVDVPENYLNRELQFKKGGQIISKYINNATLKVKRSR